MGKEEYLHLPVNKRINKIRAGGLGGKMERSGWADSLRVHEHKAGF